MATDHTRKFVQDLFDSLVETGIIERFMSSLADNVIWTATGTSPLSGRFEGKEAYISQVAMKLMGKLAAPPTPHVDKILADGEWATVHWHSSGAKGHNGVDFNMHYCWWLKVKGDKIVEVIAFFDQNKVEQLFAGTT